jgi:hypothetical protein
VGGESGGEDRIGEWGPGGEGLPGVQRPPRGGLARFRAHWGKNLALNLAICPTCLDPFGKKKLGLKFYHGF